MTELLNITVMLATIGFGLIGWLAPSYTMKKLDLAITGSRVGLSEIRAANGALFVGLGAGALALTHPVAFLMVGFVYAGAAMGRITSIVIDRSGSFISWSFFGVELALSIILIMLNGSILMS